MAILSLKNGVSSISGATVKGSFSYFSGGTRALGPSDVTGFYSGYDAPINGYTVYQIYGASGFTATVANNDTELNYILIRMGGTGTTVAQNITWATNTSTVYINSASTVYSFNIAECCVGDYPTVYSLSSSIIVGAVLYSNPQLTIPYVPYQSFFNTFRPNGGDCNSVFYDGFLIDTSSTVTAINVTGGCD